MSKKPFRIILINLVLITVLTNRRHDTVNDHLPRNDKNLHYELELIRLPKILQLMAAQPDIVGSAVSAWNIPISRCSIDFSWTMPSCYRSWEFRQRLFIPQKLSPRQWEIIFRLSINFHAIQTHLVIPFFSKWDFSQRFTSYKKKDTGTN